MMASPSTAADPVKTNFRVGTLAPQVGIALSTLQSLWTELCHRVIRIPVLRAGAVC
jgi:hypothetical protein